MQEIAEIDARLRAAAALPDVLAASFDAFEIVRMLARSCDTRMAELFAAFMTTADAAVDGREALTIAPALPAGGGFARACAPAYAEPHEIAAALAALGALLNDRLLSAGTQAGQSGDRDACAEAAEAARRIHRLMARGDHDCHVR